MEQKPRTLCTSQAYICECDVKIVLSVDLDEELSEVCNESNTSYSLQNQHTAPRIVHAVIEWTLVCSAYFILLASFYAVVSVTQQDRAPQLGNWTANSRSGALLLVLVSAACAFALWSHVSIRYPSQQRGHWLHTRLSLTVLLLPLAVLGCMLLFEPDVFKKGAQATQWDGNPDRGHCIRNEGDIFVHCGDLNKFPYVDISSFDGTLQQFEQLLSIIMPLIADDLVINHVRIDTACVRQAICNTFVRPCAWDKCGARPRSCTPPELREPVHTCAALLVQILQGQSQTQGFRSMFGASVYESIMRELQLADAYSNVYNATLCAPWDQKAIVRSRIRQLSLSTGDSIVDCGWGNVTSFETSLETDSKHDFSPVALASVSMSTTFFLVFLLLPELSLPPRSQRGLQFMNRTWRHLTLPSCTCAFLNLLSSWISYSLAVQLEADLGSADERAGNDENTLQSWSFVHTVISAFSLLAALKFLSYTPPKSRDAKHVHGAEDPDHEPQGILRHCRRLKEEWTNPATGRFFLVKVVLAEAAEVLIQLLSLSTGAINQDVTQVLVGAVTISGNLVLVPLAVLWQLRRKQLPFLTQRIVLTLLLGELFFDKIYSLTIVALRSEPILESSRGPLDLDQIILHSSAMMPLASSALDMSDVLTLQRFFKAGFKGQRELHMGLRIRRVYTWLCTAAIAFGAGFCAYMIAASATQAADCKQRIGAIAACATPRAYFSAGVFSPTECAFDRVVEFTCAHSLNNGGSELHIPDASEYREMKQLVRIDVSQNRDLASVPRSWRHAPALRTLKLAHTPGLRHLPYVLCTWTAWVGNRTDIELDLEHSNAASRLNWSGQLLTADKRELHLLDSCRDAFATSLSHLDLSRNGLICSCDSNSGMQDSGRCDCPWVDALKPLQRLSYLDLTYNNVTFLPGEFFDDLKHMEGASLALAGNRVRAARMPLVGNASFWVRSLFPARDTLTFLNIMSHSPVSHSGNFWSDMDQLTALHELWLHGNLFSQSDPQRVLPLHNGGLSHLQRLRRLVVYAFRFREGGGLQANTFHNFESLTRLDLHNADIWFADVQAFLGLSLLSRLQMNSCNMDRIPAGSFEGLSSLEELQLKSNRIVSLPSRTFANLPALTDLSLSKNPISHVASDALHGLDELLELHFDNIPSNVSLSPAVFLPLAKLSKLSLSLSLGLVLPPSVLDPLTSLIDLDLFGCSSRLLQPGIFDALGHLAILRMRYMIELASLPRGLFLELRNLHTLVLHGNSNLTIRNESFQGLENVTFMTLDAAVLRSVEAGAFQPLSKLSELVLILSLQHGWNTTINRTLVGLRWEATIFLCHIEWDRVSERELRTLRGSWGSCVQQLW